MSKTIRSYTSDGAQVLYPIDFVNGFIKREYVYVYLDTEDYTTQLTYTWISDSQIQLTSPVANGLQFHIRRVIPRDDAVNDYQDGAILKEKNLDDSYDQALMILEEVEDGYVTGPSTKIEDLIQVGQGASFVQEARPSDPVIDGVRWYKPSEATTYVWYMDDDSGQWVEENPSVIDAPNRIIPFATVAEATADTSLAEGNTIQIAERANGVFDVISGTGTANTYDIIAHTSLSLSLELRDKFKTVSVNVLGAKGDGVTDDTAAADYAISNYSKIIFERGYDYYLSGGANSIDVNRSDVEIIIDGKITQDSTGAIFHIAADGGTYSNISITGKGELRNPTTSHASETTGILIGATGAIIDNLKINLGKISMSKYGIANGAIDAELTNFKLSNSDILVNVDGWASGTDVAQAFEMNLPNATKPSGIVTGNTFRINNTTTTKGDAFKWTNGELVFGNNQCVVAGQGQTVAVFSSMDGSNITDSTFKRIDAVGTIEDVLQLNNSDDSNFKNLYAEVSGSTGGGVQLGTNTDCTYEVYTNNSIRQTASTTQTNCVLDGFSATSLSFTDDSANWDGGAVRNGTLSAQCYLNADNLDISNISVDMAGTSVRGLYIEGSNNKVDTFTIINSQASRAIQIEGGDNLLKGVVLENCAGAWEVVSGSNNKIGRIAFNDIVSANYGNVTDSGTNTGYPLQEIGGLTGTTTLNAPSNPEGVTYIELTFLSGNTTLTNITNARDKDRVVIYLTGASNTFTVNRDNAALSGGTNFTGNQYDTIELMYNEPSSTWMELSRSVNS